MIVIHSVNSYTNVLRPKDFRRQGSEAVRSFCPCFTGTISDILSRKAHNTSAITRKATPSLPLRGGSGTEFLPHCVTRHRSFTSSQSSA